MKIYRATTPTGFEMQNDEFVCDPHFLMNLDL